MHGPTRARQRSTRRRCARESLRQSSVPVQQEPHVSEHVTEVGAELHRVAGHALDQLTHLAQRGGRGSSCTSDVGASALSAAAAEVGRMVVFVPLPTVGATTATSRERARTGERSDSPSDDHELALMVDRGCGRRPRRPPDSSARVGRRRRARGRATVRVEHDVVVAQCGEASAAPAAVVVDFPDPEGPASRTVTSSSPSVPAWRKA